MFDITVSIDLLCMYFLLIYLRSAQMSIVIIAKVPKLSLLPRLQ